MRVRGLDQDTRLYIICGCAETDEELDDYCDWLEAHPEASHDTMFRYALEEYGGFDLEDYCETDAD